MAIEHAGELDGSDVQAAPDASTSNVTSALENVEVPIPDRAEFNVQRHREIMRKVSGVLKNRIKSLRCSICDQYFDQDNRQPITCQCKISFCRMCYSLKAHSCGCGNNIDTSCCDLEVFSIINGELSDLDAGIKEAVDTESMIDVLDALGIDLQRQYEGRMYYGKFMEDHTKQLEEVSQKFSTDVLGFYNCCELLNVINETNAIEIITKALDKLKTLSSSVDAINVALIKTFRLHSEETNMQIFLNLRTLNFSKELSDALSVSKRNIWIVTAELGEDKLLFFKLCYVTEEKSYYMYSIQNTMDGTIDPVIIDLKSFETQNLVCTGIFMTLAMEECENAEHREQRFFFRFNQTNTLLNKQVMLFCTGQRFRCFKNCPCLFLPDQSAAITPVTILAQEFNHVDTRCVDVTEDGDLFDGIPDVGTHIEPPAIGDVFATRSIHNYSQINLKFNICEKVVAPKNYDVIATLAKKNVVLFQDFFSKAILADRTITVAECGATYKLRPDN